MRADTETAEHIIPHTQPFSEGTSTKISATAYLKARKEKSKDGKNSGEHITRSNSTSAIAGWTIRNTRRNGSKDAKGRQGSRMGAESRGLCRGIRANRGTGHAYRWEAAPVTREAEKIGFGGGGGGGRARRIQGEVESVAGRERARRATSGRRRRREESKLTRRDDGEGERRGGERHFRRGKRRWVLVRYR